MKPKSKYKISHPKYGVWWVTSVYKFSQLIGTSLSYLYGNMKRGKKVFKDWRIEETDEDFNDIPYKYINPTMERVIVWYSEQPEEFLEVVENLKKMCKNI